MNKTPDDDDINCNLNFEWKDHDFNGHSQMRTDTSVCIIYVYVYRVNVGTVNRFRTVYRTGIHDAVQSTKQDNRITLGTIQQTPKTIPALHPPYTLVPPPSASVVLISTASSRAKGTVSVIRFIFHPKPLSQLESHLASLNCRVATWFD